MRLRKKNLSALYVLQFVNAIAPLFVLPFLTRSLGTAEYGALVYFQSLIAYGTIFLDYGFYISAVRDVARARHTPEKLSRVIKAIFTAKLIVLTFVAAMMAVAAIFIRSIHDSAWLFFLCGLQLIGNIALPMWLFQGLELSHKILIPQIIARAVTTILIILLVRSNADISIAALLVSCSDMLCGLLLWRDISRHIQPTSGYSTLRDAIVILRDDTSFFLTSLGSNLCVAFNPLLLEIFYDHTQVALYAAPLRIVTMATRSITPVISSVSPVMARLVVENPLDARRFLKKVAMALCGGAILLGVAIFLFAPAIIKLFAGEGFIDAASVLRVFAILPLLVVLSSLIGQTYAVHRGMGTALAKIYWIAGICNVAVLIPLIRLYGATGAAVTVVIAELFIVGSILILITRSEGARGSTG